MGQRILLCNAQGCLRYIATHTFSSFILSQKSNQDGTRAGSKIKHIGKWFCQRCLNQNFGLRTRVQYIRCDDVPAIKKIAPTNQMRNWLPMAPFKNRAEKRSFFRIAQRIVSMQINPIRRDIHCSSHQPACITRPVRDTSISQHLIGRAQRSLNRRHAPISASNVACASACKAAIVSSKSPCITCARLYSVRLIR